MRTTRVLTNETCTQNCGFCTARRAVESRAFVHPSAVRARIEQARASGTRELVLTGGEPTLRRDLESLITFARDRAVRVALETNATLIDEARAQTLAAAGLGRAYVHLPGVGDTYERVTRDEGSFALALRGLRALAGAGVALVARVPVVQHTCATLAEVPAYIAREGLALESLELHLPTSAPDPTQLAAVTSALDAIERTLEAARSHGVSARMAPGAAPPPCLFARPERVAHAYALTRGGRDDGAHRRVDACTRCLAQDRCAGVPVGIISRDPSIAQRARPIESDRVRRRLTVIETPQAQARRELLTEEHVRTRDGTVLHAGVVRVNFNCNQSCEFCFVSTHLPTPDDADVRVAIERAAAWGVVVLSGGEPTLNARLTEYVALARERGARVIELQSNAVRFATDPALARALAAAGLTQAMISLHGSTAELSDAVTAAPGTFEKTLRGIDALRDAGITVRLNHVVCAQNAGDFARFVALVAARFAGAAVTVSFVGTHTDVVPRTRAVLPRLRDLGPALEEGIALAHRLGVVLEGFESMCGFPPCAIPETVRALVPIPLGTVTGLDGEDAHEFVKPPGCRECAYDARCYGLRRGYVALYGDDDARAVRAPVLAREPETR